jgi:hypothetical protein
MKRASTESGSQPEDHTISWFATTAPALLKKMADAKHRLRWLVEDFARRRNYSDPERAPEAVVREVAGFLIYQNEPGTMYLGRLPRLSARELQALSSEIESSVNRFLNGEDWTIPLEAKPPLLGMPPISRCIRRRTVEFGRDKGKRMVVASWRSSSTPAPARSFALIFRLAAQDLVVSEHEYLAKCGGCETVFVCDDLRQSFCTPRCNAATRMRRHRASKRPPEPAPKTARRRASRDQKKTRKNRLTPTLPERLIAPNSCATLSKRPEISTCARRAGARN